jgi:hypothetical protein
MFQSAPLTEKNLPDQSGKVNGLGLLKPREVPQADTTSRSLS